MIESYMSRPSSPHTPLVSIIMPMYNAAAFVGKSIESVCLQSYPNWELLLIDDASSDESLDIAREYKEKDTRIFIFIMPRNSGRAQARNLGIENARGQIIAFLDSDDLWHPDKLTRQIAFMTKNTVAWSFTDYVRIDENDLVLASSDSPFERVDGSILLRTNPIGMLTVAYDTRMLGKHFFVNNDVNREDYLLWLGMARTGAVAQRLPERLASYRVVKNSQSANKLSMVYQQWRTLSQLDVSVLPRFFYLAQYIYYALKKRRKG